MMFEKVFPPMLDTVEKLGDWLDQHPGEEIPEMPDAHEFSIRGIAEKRRIRPYNQWMSQRPIGRNQSLSGEDKSMRTGF